MTVICKKGQLACNPCNADYTTKEQTKTKPSTYQNFSRSFCRHRLNGSSIFAFTYTLPALNWSASSCTTETHMLYHRWCNSCEKNLEKIHTGIQMNIYNSHTNLIYPRFTEIEVHILCSFWILHHVHNASWTRFWWLVAGWLQHMRQKL